MTDRGSSRLLVCYVPGLDTRKVAAGLCPHVKEMMQSYPVVRFTSPPAAHRLASLLTGAYPHEHGFWGPRLRSGWRERTARQQMVDLLPDVVTTTAQCVQHVVNGPVELATIPPRRRRKFEWMRFTMKHEKNVQRLFSMFRHVPTVLQVVGEERARYVYCERWSESDGLLENLGEGSHRLELVDFHCLDRVQHWYVPEDDRVAEAYRRVDAFIEALHAKCRGNGVQFVVISDHGMEPVKRHLDLRAKLAAAGVPRADYDLFVENVRCTFWFHTAEARQKLTDLLQACDDGVLVKNEELAQYGVRFQDDAYGHAYFYVHPGISLFPNDFHQKVASFYLGLRDPQQRRRMVAPYHVADHGYLPHHECEIGFVVVADDRYHAPGESVHLIDLAPTFLELLGCAKPPTMRGTSAFSLATEPLRQGSEQWVAGAGAAS
jgi:Type I phosphodiesterase / nucleotide pyrophosphatase